MCKGLGHAQSGFYCWAMLFWWGGLAAAAGILRVAWSIAWALCHGEGDFEWGSFFTEEMEMLCGMSTITGEEKLQLLSWRFISQSLV